MSDRYGEKPPDAQPNGVITAGGRYGKRPPQKTIIPPILKCAIDVNGYFLMKDDRHEVYIETDHALYVDTETWSLKTDLNGGT